MNDLRFAFRQLLKNPGFTAVAVLTLALGIGANTAIFSVVNSTLLNAVPGPQPERLIRIGEQDKKQQQANHFSAVTPPVLQALRASQDAFDGFAWWEGMQLARKTDDFVDVVFGFKVSFNLFTMLDAKPILGRTFARDDLTPILDDGNPGADSVIVISYSFWQSVFGGDANVIGKSIELTRSIESPPRRFTVIGVMPGHFKFPFDDTDGRFWMAAEDPRVRSHVQQVPSYSVLVRLKPGASVQQTQAMLDVLAQRLTREYSGDSWQATHGYGAEMRKEGWGLRTRPLREMLTDQKLQQTLWGLLAAIGFVLLIVCANVANLLLAKTEKRQQELAVRAALGASRFRIMRQLLTESVLLAGLGGLGGLVITMWGTKLLVSLIPATMPRLKEVQVDAHALGFTLLVSLGTALVFGLAPALWASRTPVSDALKQGENRATLPAGWRRYRSVLVVAEVALTLVLLAGAGLMIQSVVNLLHVKPGFDHDNLLQVRIYLPGKKYADPEKRESRNLILAQLRDRVAALPGVVAVGLSQPNFAYHFKIEGREEPVRIRVAGAGVDESNPFQAMGVPLLAGRHLSEDDIAGDLFHRNDITEGISSVIINETLARLCWPGENALGKKFRKADQSSRRTYEVAGVVGDIRDYRYDQQVEPMFYRPYPELSSAPDLMVRTAADPHTLIPAIRGELKAAEPGMNTPRIRFVRQDLYDATQPQRTYMIYMVVLAIMGLLLAALGIYGVLAYSVARRTREFGIRMAVGAERRHVLSVVMKEGGRLAGTGVLVGLVAAFWLTRVLRHQLFAVSPTEPGVFLGVILLLSAVALLACLLPACRAMRINPMEALRHE